MTIPIWLSDKIPGAPATLIKQFLQYMANALLQGQCRYGKPSQDKMYLTRLNKELQVYMDTGIKEHLVNVANYAYLEYNWPQHKNAHCAKEGGVRSVTRGRREEGII